MQSYTRIDQGELRERRIKGYQNAMRFHKMFVEAGGHLVVSGNTNDAWPPGVDLHQEMQVMAEAGLTPIQIIVGSTKCPHRLLGSWPFCRMDESNHLPALRPDVCAFQSV